MFNIAFYDVEVALDVGIESAAILSYLLKVHGPTSEFTINSGMIAESCGFNDKDAVKNAINRLNTRNYIAGVGGQSVKFNIEKIVNIKVGVVEGSRLSAHLQNAEFRTLLNKFYDIIKRKSGKIDTIRVEKIEDTLLKMTTELAIQCLRYSCNNGFVTLYECKDDRGEDGGKKPSGPTGRNRAGRESATFSKSNRTSGTGGAGGAEAGTKPFSAKGIQLGV